MSTKEERICQMFRESCGGIRKSKQDFNWRTESVKRTVLWKGRLISHIRCRFLYEVIQDSSVVGYNVEDWGSHDLKPVKSCLVRC
jgi:hypothetical protein